MKKLIIILAVLLVAGCFGGCQPSDTADNTETTSKPTTEPTESTSESAEPSAPAEPTVLSAVVMDAPNVEDFNTNTVTLWLESELNVDLEIEVFPGPNDDYNNKINLMVTSGDELADIIFGNFSDTWVYSWAKEGALSPLKAYYSDTALAVNLYEAMDRVGTDFRGAITMPDEEIYYVPRLNQSYGNEFKCKFWYYADWFDQLGMDVPTTTDELYEVLKKVTTSDPNGNGVADEVGIAGYGGIYSMWFSWIMNAFIYSDYDHNFVKIEDGIASYAFTDDAWRDGIEYMKMLVAEGCLPTETVTQDWSAWETMLNTADHTAFATLFYTADQITDDTIRGNFTALAPVTGPEGVQYAQNNPSSPSCTMVISADCENPEAAFKVGDLMTCEVNSIGTRFGEQGVDWDYISDISDADKYVSPYPAFDPYILVYDDSNFWGSGAMQNRSWMQRGPYIRQYGIAAGMAVDPETVSEYTKNVTSGLTLYQQGGYAPDEVIVKLVYNDEEISVAEEVQANLKSYVTETMAGWILGTSPLDDTSWAEFQSTLETLKAFDLLEVIQAAYTRSAVD